MPRDIQTTRIDTETISPEKYIQLSDKEKMNISQTKIVPPQLGQNSFGKIQITYKTPIFKATK